MSQENDPRDQVVLFAREALRNHDYAEARRLFEAAVSANPDDLEAQVELGIAELLGADVKAFEKTFEQLEHRLPAPETMGERLDKLWKLLVSLSRSMTRAAATLTLAALPISVVGCSESEQTPVTDLSVPTISSQSDASTEPLAPLDATAAPEQQPRPTSEQAPDAAPAPSDASGGIDAAPMADADARPVVSPRPPRPGSIRDTYPPVTRYRVANPRYRVSDKGK